MNKEIIIVELLQALIGSIGILTVIPFSTFISATIYLKGKKDFVEMVIPWFMHLKAKEVGDLELKMIKIK